jgi:hypothetical protein
MKFRISIALLLALAPSMAVAKPRTATTHMRPQLFRDRSPRARLQAPRIHEIKVRPPKSPPPPPVKEDFEL